MSQLEMFATPNQPASTAPSVDQVRARLQGLLKTLRSAETLPLTDKQLRFWQTVVPQMSNWLPDDERAAVQTEFSAQVERLARRAA